VGCVATSVLEKDKRNNLALLRTSSTQMASAETLSLISKLGAQKLEMELVPLASRGLMRSDDIELGESVMVAGYPYGELYSNTVQGHSDLVEDTFEVSLSGFHLHVGHIFNVLLVCRNPINPSFLVT
jgi:hypothetical protein